MKLGTDGKMHDRVRKELLSLPVAQFDADGGGLIGPKEVEKHNGSAPAKKIVQARLAAANGGTRAGRFNQGD